jgi:hypothetical protein
MIALTAQRISHLHNLIHELGIAQDSPQFIFQFTHADRPPNPVSYLKFGDLASAAEWLPLCVSYLLWTCWKELAETGQEPAVLLLPAVAFRLGWLQAALFAAD